MGNSCNLRTQLALLLALCWIQLSNSASMTETETGSTSGTLGEPQGILVIELLKRVRMLEERARLVEQISLNQQTQFESLHRLLERQETSLEKLDGRFTEKVNITEMKSGNNGCRSTDAASTQTHSTVAFTAYLSANIGSPVAGKTVIFDAVILNEGNAYNQVTGIFQAPQDGVYDFFFSTGQYSSKYAELRLMVNGTLITYTRVTNPASSGQQSSSRAFVRLETGDAVRVVIYSANHIESYHKMTSFSGVLVS